MAHRKKLPTVHPGEVLREDYLKHWGMAPYTLARHMGIPRTRIERIVREETPVTADTALRLARVLGTTAQFWLYMQSRFDLESAEDAIKGELAKLSPIAA